MFHGFSPLCKQHSMLDPRSRLRVCSGNVDNVHVTAVLGIGGSAPALPLPTASPGRLSDTQRGDNTKFVSAAALALIGCLVGFNSANAQGAAMKNDADDQNSRH